MILSYLHYSALEDSSEIIPEMNTALQLTTQLLQQGYEKKDQESRNKISYCERLKLQEKKRKKIIRRTELARMPIVMAECFWGYQDSSLTKAPQRYMRSRKDDNRIKPRQSHYFWYQVSRLVDTVFISNLICGLMFQSGGAALVIQMRRM